MRSFFWIHFYIKIFNHNEGIYTCDQKPTLKWGFDKNGQLLSLGTQWMDILGMIGAKNPNPLKTHTNATEHHGLCNVG